MEIQKASYYFIFYFQQQKNKQNKKKLAKSDYLDNRY